MEAKKSAIDRLSIKKEDEEFFAILSLVNDDAQDIETELFDHFKALDED